MINLFQTNKKILSIYFSAGYPNINDTVPIIQNLEKAGVDLIEIGLPFSDPLADGPTIQESSTQALQNGMTTKLLFEQLKNIRNSVQIPLIIMGYFNPMMQYGVENFCKKCSEIGINGLIIPDLPIEIYETQYKSIFEKYNLSMVFLITPQTPENRIRYIDSLSTSFIYMVSSATITGGSNSEFNHEQIAYFERVQNMNLKNKLIIGFGIHNKTTFKQATQYANGAIIGSAFIKYLHQNGVNKINEFVNEFL